MVEVSIKITLKSGKTLELTGPEVDELVAALKSIGKVPDPIVFPYIPPVYPNPCPTNPLDPVWTRPTTTCQSDGK